MTADPVELPAEMRAHIELLEQQLTDWIRAETGNPLLSIRYGTEGTTDATDEPSRRAVAARLLHEAARLDPGLPAARLSLYGPTRRKQQAIADHYEAIGIRRALDELGLVYPNG